MDGVLAPVDVVVLQRQLPVAGGVHCVAAHSQATFEYRTWSLIVLGNEHCDSDSDVYPQTMMRPGRRGRG
jgi:hypothetical protein